MMITLAYWICGAGGFILLCGFVIWLGNFWPDSVEDIKNPFKHEKLG